MDGWMEWDVFVIIDDSSTSLHRAVSSGGGQRVRAQRPSRKRLADPE